MSTTAATYRERLELAETSYDRMMTTGNGTVEYTEPSTGVRIRKDPAQMLKYLEYLRERVSATTSSASRGGNTTYGTMRRPS